MSSLPNNSTILNSESLQKLQTTEKSHHLRRRAAVIGAGPSGIQAAGELVKRNFHVTVFERHNQSGGIWCYEKNKHLSQPNPYQGVKPFLPHEVSPVYKDMRTNVTFQAMGIDGFPIPQPEKIRFVHRSEILDYLNAYVTHLSQEYPEQVEYRFNSNVESATYNNGWKVTSQKQGKATHETFYVLVVATGAFHTPSGANLHDPEFKGIYFHSLYYNDPSVLENRKVLIVGGKNSARDVFWDAMECAKHVVLACPTEKDRNNVVFPDDPSSKIQEKATFIGRVKRIQKNGTVIQTNWQGQDEELSDIEVDVIVYCTGYSREFPFLPKKFQPTYLASDRTEIPNYYLFTAHKNSPNSLFFFHPSKARTPFNTISRETQAQARLIALLANQQVFSTEQLEKLEETLQTWMDIVYAEWYKDSLNSCPCAIHNPLFMNYLNAIVDHNAKLSGAEKIGYKVMNLVRNKMADMGFRKQNTIWHAGMELRVRADAANWNLFKFLSGRLTAGPDVDGSDFYEVTWLLADGSKHSTFREDEIKYEDLILNREPEGFRIGTFSALKH